eukprot:5524934-Amphidinium_carterae.1
MIAASPHLTNANETLSALRFGARASLVQNLARENVAEDCEPPDPLEPPKPPQKKTDGQKKGEK